MPPDREDEILCVHKRVYSVIIVADGLSFQTRGMNSF